MSLESELNKIKKGEFAPLYLVHGTEKHLNEQTKEVFLSSILTSEEKEFNYARFDMETVSVDKALEEALSAPFFGDRKLVFADNALFLTGEKPKTEVMHDLKWLEEYCESPSPETVLVIFAPYEKLDQRKTVVKKLKKAAFILETSALNEQKTRLYLEERIKNQAYQIDHTALNLLLQLTGSNLTASLKELDKLMLFALDKKVITADMVQELTVKGLEENVFELMDKILQKDAAGSLYLFQSLLDQKEEPIKIIALLLSQFRLLLQVKILRSKGYQQGDISKFLKLHPYRVKLASRQEKKFALEDLSQAFNGLIETDYHLKTGHGHPITQFEVFILSFSEKQSQRQPASLVR